MVSRGWKRKSRTGRFATGRFWPFTWKNSSFGEDRVNSRDILCNENYGHCLFLWCFNAVFLLSISADGLYDFYLVIVDPFCFHSLIKLTFLASKDFCVYMINKIIHGRAWIRNFSSCVQLDISLARSAHLWAIEVNTRREFPYPHVPMYYSLFNKLLRETHK